jgi:adenylate kinase family enzyme
MYDVVMHEASKVVKVLVGDAPPRRVAVIGRAGAGKTTVALRLGDVFGLPVVHLDRLAWDPGWQAVAEAAFEARQAEAVASDAWVIDGGYLSSVGWPERMRRADVVILVEAPLLVCLARIIRRAVARGGERRPDLPDGCVEHLSLAFIGWTLLWKWRTRAALRRLDEAGGRVVRVRSTMTGLRAAAPPYCDPASAEASGGGTTSASTGRSGSA